MLEKIKHLYDRFHNPYTFDSRKYNEELIKKFEDSEIDEVI